jgi:diguanylate cyclase (GGDEF)-like protein/PAS domain S-box-containing protein
MAGAMLSMGSTTGASMKAPLPEAESRRLAGTQTREELLRFRIAMDMSGDAIYLVDRASMRFVDVNQTACKRMGYSREELLRLGPQDLLKSSREDIEKLYDEVIAAGAGGVTTESTARTKDGRESMTELHRCALRSGDGWIIVSIARDITLRKRAEQALLDAQAALRHRESELQLLTDNVPAMIMYVDRELKCVVVNRRYAEFFGFTPADLVGKPLRQIVGGAAYPQLEPHFLQALGGRPAVYQRNVRLSNGEDRCIEVKVVPRAAVEGEIPGCYSMAIDITEQREAEERIRHMANHDSLTGLPNRMLFNDRLAQTIRFAKRVTGQFGLLYLDLDKFKPVNDVHGHDAGDQLLKSVGERIRAQLRESDTVARLGGDEFAVIIPDVKSPEDVALVARKIIAALTAPFLVGANNNAVEVGTSIGIVVYPGDAKDHESLIRKADLAMYAAKQAGGSGFSFSAA